MWLSLVQVRQPGPDRPAGLYGVGVVDYRGGTLDYHELLVARPVRTGATRGVRITDIWVDSEASLTGGRALWAIPKQPAHLDLSQHYAGPWLRARACVADDAGRVATAAFTTSRIAGPRVPVRFTVHQHRPDGTPVQARVVGSVRWTPATGTWSMPVEGPLGWLAHHRPLASMCLSGFRLRFGG